MKRTEIYILSGFLGSGKTTLLEQLLQFEKKRGRKVGVIMNELGKVSVDSTSVSQDTPLKELLDGCVCCSIQGKFEIQLDELLTEKQLEVIFIETTGVAHPFEVFDACLSPLFANQVDVRGIITIVDLMRWVNRDKLPVEMQDLLYEQISMGDLLLLNKMDLLTESELGQCLFEIQGINSLAQAILTSHTSINLEEIFKLQSHDKKEHTPVQVGKHLSLNTMVYRFTQPVDYEAFLTFIETLPDTIIRMKGFIRFNHSDTLYSFQYAWGEPVFFPYEEETEELIVIIATELDVEAITEGLTLL